MTTGVDNVKVVESDIDLQQTYKKVEVGQSIINTLIENIYNDESYQEYMKELEEADTKVSNKKLKNIKQTFENICIYNNNAEPLFLARDIGNIINASNITVMIKNYTHTEKVTKIIEDKSGKKKEFVFLTKHGLYRVLLTNRTKLSDLFRGFIYKLLDHMFSHEINKMRNFIAEVIREHPELAAASMKELDHDIKTYREMYYDENNRRIELENLNVSLDMANNFNKMYIVQLKNEKSHIMDRMRARDIDESMEADRVALETVKKKYMKEVFIYLVKPELLEKHIFSGKINESFINNGIYMHDEYISCFPFYLKMLDQQVAFNSEEYYYLYVVFKKLDSDNQDYVYLGSEFVYDKDKFAELVKALTTDCDYYNPGAKANKINFIYRTTINTIKNLVRDGIIS
jgi:hypothetical protein